MKKNEDNKYSLSQEQLQELIKYREGTTTNQYEAKPQRTILTALNDKGELMDIDEYCAFYRTPREEVRSYKLVSHTGVPYYCGVKVPVLANEINWLSLRKSQKQNDLKI